MRYVCSKCNQQAKERAYRVYVTDCLQNIAENTAKYVRGKAISARWDDIVSGRYKPDDRTGEEIAADVIKRAGLVVRKDECV